MKEHYLIESNHDVKEKLAKNFPLLELDSNYSLFLQWLLHYLFVCLFMCLFSDNNVLHDSLPGPLCFINNHYQWSIRNVAHIVVYVLIYILFRATQTSSAVTVIPMCWYFHMSASPLENTRSEAGILSWMSSR